MSDNSPYQMLPLYKISQTRIARQDFDEEELQALSESIANHGLIQPLTDRQTDSGYYQIAGERRWRASRMAGLAEVPAVIMDADDRKAMELALIENLQRRGSEPHRRSPRLSDPHRRVRLDPRGSGRSGGKIPPCRGKCPAAAEYKTCLEMVRSGKLTPGAPSCAHPERPEKADGSRPEDLCAGSSPSVKRNCCAGTCPGSLHRK